ncbi:MAG: transcriptional antiterminator, Rof [Sulfuriferula sp.]
MSVYQPVSCVQHEQLEFAVLKRKHLHISYVDGQQQSASADILPLDVYTEGAAEWLRLQRADGCVEIIRLDKLLSVKELG